MPSKVKMDEGGEGRIWSFFRLKAQAFLGFVLYSLEMYKFLCPFTSSLRTLERN